MAKPCFYCPAPYSSRRVAYDWKRHAETVKPDAGKRPGLPFLSSYASGIAGQILAGTLIFLLWLLLWKIIDRVVQTYALFTALLAVVATKLVLLIWRNVRGKK